MSLTDNLKALKQKLREETPRPHIEAMDRVAEDLARLGIAYQAVGRGDRAPDFKLPNAVGRLVRLSDCLRNGPVVLSFYRGHWCPYCSEELQALQEDAARIQETGATLLAVSPQTPDNSVSTTEKHGLTFDVLSDVGNRVASLYGLAFQVPEELRPIYRELGIELSNYNQEDAWELPIPATYVIDKDGVIQTAFVDPDYTRRMDPKEIVEALKELRGEVDPGRRRTTHTPHYKGRWREPRL